MREHLGFLKVSSAVVKFAAWIFLFLGLTGGMAIILGFVPGRSVIEGMVDLAMAAFFFFFLYIIAKIAELLMKMIEEIHEIKGNKTGEQDAA